MRASFPARDAEFAAFEAHALRRHAVGDAPSAAAWAQIACHVGWARPGAQLTAPRLEAMLNEIGRALVPAPSRRRPSGDPQRVLHVMTECYATGGHSRVVERWVGRDRRAATVVLTDQRAPVPASFTDRIAAAGGDLVTGLPGRDLIERASSLRELADRHDLIVLHTHMHDVLPSLAFADPAGRAPVVLLDHAMHHLWIGAGATDVIASIRSIEHDVVTRRRGFPDDRTALLPLLLDRRRLPTRAEARTQMGLSPDVPLVLSVASPWKVQPALDPTFTELCEQILERNSSALLIIVGPPATPPWQALARRFPGRLVMPGGVSDIAPLLAAADLFLDPWPISGATTIVDVAAAGLPIVSLTDGSTDLGIVQAVAPLGRGAECVSSPERLGTTVRSLLDDPERRREMSEHLLETVDRDHDRGWDDHLEVLVAKALRYAGSGRPLAPAASAVDDWQVLTAMMQHETEPPSPSDVIRHHLDVLPAAERPADLPGLQALADAVLAKPRRHGRGPTARAVAAPAVDGTAIADTVADFRRLLDAGLVGGCVVLLDEADVEAGLRQLQAAIDSGSDVDIDVITGTSLAAVLRPGDLEVG